MTNLGFRSWYYFRMGWSTYFAFLFAAINTLTVTYYLAIERIPELTSIFPSFLQYVLIITGIGIPILICVGYIHYKRTKAFKSEVDVILESNPYQRRNVVNISLIFESIIKTNQLLLKLSKNENHTISGFQYNFIDTQSADEISMYMVDAFVGESTLRNAYTDSTLRTGAPTIQLLINEPDAEQIFVHQPGYSVLIPTIRYSEHIDAASAIPYVDDVEYNDIHISIQDYGFEFDPDSPDILAQNVDTDDTFSRVLLIVSRG